MPNCSNPNAGKATDRNESFRGSIAGLRSQLKQFASLVPTSMPFDKHVSRSELFDLTRELLLISDHILDVEGLSALEKIYQSERDLMQKLGAIIYDISDECLLPKKKEAERIAALQDMTILDTQTLSLSMNIEHCETALAVQQFNEFFQFCPRPNPAELTLLEEVTGIPAALLNAKFKSLLPLYVVRNDSTGAEGGCARLLRETREKNRMQKE